MAGDIYTPNVINSQSISPTAPSQSSTVFSPTALYAETHSYLTPKVKTYKNKKGQVIGYEANHQSVALSKPISKEKFNKVIKINTAKEIKPKPQARIVPKKKATPQQPKSFFQRVGAWFHKADTVVSQKIKPITQPIIHEFGIISQAAGGKPLDMANVRSSADIMNYNLIRKGIGLSPSFNRPLTKMITKGTSDYLSGTVSQIQDHPVSTGAVYAGTTIATAGLSGIADISTPAVSQIAKNFPKTFKIAKEGAKGIGKAIGIMWAGGLAKDVVTAKNPVKMAGRKTVSDVIPFFTGVKSGKSIYKGIKTAIAKRAAVKSALGSIKIAGQLGEYRKGEGVITKTNKLHGSFKFGTKKKRFSAQAYGVGFQKNKDFNGVLNLDLKIGRKKTHLTDIYTVPAEGKIKGMRYTWKPNSFISVNKQFQPEGQLVRGMTYQGAFNKKKASPYTIVNFNLMKSENRGLKSGLYLRIGKGRATIQSKKGVLNFKSGGKQVDIFNIKSSTLTGVRNPTRKNQFIIRSKEAFKKGAKSLIKINKEMWGSKSGSIGSRPQPEIETIIKRKQIKGELPLGLLSKDIEKSIASYTRSQFKVPFSSISIPPLLPSTFRVGVGGKIKIQNKMKSGLLPSNLPIFKPNSLFDMTRRRIQKKKGRQNPIQIQEPKKAIKQKPILLPRVFNVPKTKQPTKTEPPIKPPAILKHFPHTDSFILAPFIGLPLGFTGGSFLIQNKRNNKSQRKFGYEPSIIAMEFKIKGKPTKFSKISGLTLRPIPVKW